MASPFSGVVVPGTNGIRKTRFSPSHSRQGKSGAYRVFYVFLPEFGIVLLMAVIAKHQQANLSKADRNALARVVGRLKRLLEQGDIR
jgi:hypothetical protein